jgi:hypothetical protein
MLDWPEGVCAGQAGFEYPATSVLFSNKSSSQKCCLFAQIYRTGSELQYGKATACAH